MMILSTTNSENTEPLFLMPLYHRYSKSDHVAMMISSEYNSLT